MKVLSLPLQRSLHLILLLPLLCHEVAANTEIINFSSSREPTVDLPVDLVGNWSRLHPTDNEQRWSLEPAALHTPLHQACERLDDAVAFRPPFSSCPHELWLLLDLDDEKWAPHSTFTLRLSWPASTPADFAITLHSPRDLLVLLSERAGTRAHASSNASITAFPRAPTTRSRYARIRAVHAGVPTPGTRSHRSPVPAPPSLLPPRARAPGSIVGDDVAAAQGEVVPFVVVLEPAYWGVLPASLLPTVGFLIAIVLAAAAFVPWVTACFEPYARQAREDLKTGTTGVNKDR